MMQVRPSVLVKGTATFIPGATRFACSGSGGTDSASYCYSVWLRHWEHLRRFGFDRKLDTVAELGPGDSLGIGLAAMLSGTNRYFALDALRHAGTSRNVQTLDELAECFRRRDPIPDTDMFPEIWPPIESRTFPSALHSSVSAERVAAIREALRLGGAENIEVRYFAPWTDVSVVQPASVDLVLSQAVLEHVEDIDATYTALYSWLKPGGVMSHQIDFRSHSLTRDWYGHWTLPRWIWRLVKGRRPYLINRSAASTHEWAMQRHGFEIVEKVPQYARPPARRELAAEFQNLEDDDLRTSGLYVIARKPLL